MDGNLIRARKMWAHKKGKEGQEKERIDLGMVGEVETINPEVIRTFMANKWIPVIAPVGAGPGGEIYNINADLVAGKVASSLGQRIHRPMWKVLNSQNGLHGYESPR
jgi:acetylglutamate kinase